MHAPCIDIMTSHLWRAIVIVQSGILYPGDAFIETNSSSPDKPFNFPTLLGKFVDFSADFGFGHCTNMTQRFCVTCRKRHETPTGKKCPFRRETEEIHAVLRRFDSDSHSFEAISSQLHEMQGQMSSFAEQLIAVQANRVDKAVVCANYCGLFSQNKKLKS